MFGMGKPKNGINTIFGRDGMSTALTIGNMTQVVGPDGRSTTYTRLGNTATATGPDGRMRVYTDLGNGVVLGPDGVHTSIKCGNATTFFGPGGSSKTVIHNGSTYTVL